MNDTGITQTSELLAVIGALWHDIAAAKKEGGVSKMEIVRMIIGNAGKVIAACDGIAEVPKEIADIHPEEMDALYWRFMEQVGWPEGSESRDVFNIIFNFTYHGVNSWRLLENTLNPPKARVIPDDLNPTTP